MVCINLFKVKKVKFEFVIILETGVTPVIQEGLGVVDFYPSNAISVVWITEEVIIGSSSAVLKKIKKLDEVHILPLTSLF